MSIDLAPYEQRMREAQHKLKGDTGSAAHTETVLSGLAGDLTAAGKAHQSESDKLKGNWEGTKGKAFGDRAKEKTDALTEASGWAQRTAKSINDASTLVKQAETEVTNLLNEFHSAAKSIADGIPVPDPGHAAEQRARSVIGAMAARYDKDAANVLSTAKARLAEIVAHLGGTKPSNTGGGDGPLGSRSSGGGGGGGGGGTGGGGGGGGNVASTGPVQLTPPSDQYGSGTKVKLPGGQTVEAPNERAAIAVRAALSRLGLPYVWGGTDPNKGMDCSGLTQWAYGQAGVKIPRVANTQTVGQKVDIHDIQPGDLVIWSGHVAMYIGNGQMVEEPHTGAVCHVVPLRTTNAGEPLLGVFRPSAR